MCVVVVVETRVAGTACLWWDMRWPSSPWLAGLVCLLDDIFGKNSMMCWIEGLYAKRTHHLQ